MTTSLALAVISEGAFVIAFMLRPDEEFTEGMFAPFTEGKFAPFTEGMFTPVTSGRVELVEGRLIP